jgi:hypothetical protein
MSSLQKKYSSPLELINAFVLVNSDYLLERDAGVYNFLSYVRARIRTRAENNKNNSLRLYYPAVTFIGKNDETGISPFLLKNKNGCRVVDYRRTIRTASINNLLK